MISVCRLPRSARLNDDKRAEVLRSAARLRGRWFLIRRVRNDVGFARVLIRIAKKIMRGAVARNRIRRCVKEVFRQQRMKLPAVDYFVSVINPYAEPSLFGARQELEQLLHTQTEQR